MRRFPLVVGSLALAALLGAYWGWADGSARRAGMTREEVREVLARPVDLRPHDLPVRRELLLDAPSGASYLRVRDARTGGALEGVGVRIASACEDILSERAWEGTTDAQGRVAYVAERSSWVCLCKDGYAPRTIASSDPVWRGSSEGDSEARLCIDLEPANTLEMCVRSFDGDPIPGARVRVVGRWGREALDHSSDSPWTRAFASLVETDERGQVVLTPPEHPLLVEVSAPGWSTDFTSWDRLCASRSVELGCLLVMALRVPDPALCDIRFTSSAPHRQRLGGSLAAELTRGLQQRVPGADVVWLLQRETGPIEPAELEERIEWQAVPGGPFTEIRARYHRVSDFTEDCVTELRDPAATSIALGELCVERRELALDESWGIWSDRFERWWIPSALPLEDRPSVPGGRDHYRFRLPEGDYRLRSDVSLLGRRFDEVELSVRAGRVEWAKLPPEDGRSTLVTLDVQEQSGRRLSYCSVLARDMETHGRVLLGRSASPARRVRLPNGRFEFECATPGYERSVQEVELSGGEQTVSFVLEPSPEGAKAPPSRIQQLLAERRRRAPGGGGPR